MAKRYSPSRNNLLPTVRYSIEVAFDFFSIVNSLFFNKTKILTFTFFLARFLIRGELNLENLFIFKILLTVKIKNEVNFMCKKSLFYGEKFKCYNKSKKAMHIKIVLIHNSFSVVVLLLQQALSPSDLLTNCQRNSHICFFKFCLCHFKILRRLLIN